MVGTQVEQVGGEDGWSEETQEDETAHCRVSDILVNWRAENTKTGFSNTLYLMRICTQSEH